MNEAAGVETAGVDSAAERLGGSGVDGMSPSITACSDRVAGDGDRAPMKLRPEEEPLLLLPLLLGPLAVVVALRELMALEGGLL